MFTKSTRKLNFKIAFLASNCALALFVVFLFCQNYYPFGDNINLSIQGAEVFSYIFSESFLPLGLEIVLGIKIFVASFIMSLFLSKIIDVDACSIALAICWSFSCLVFAPDMSMMLLDIAIMLPLIVWAYERFYISNSLDSTSRKSILKLNMPYIICIFAIILLDFMVLGPILLFLVMWTVLYFVFNPTKGKLYLSLQILINTVLGILLDAVFIIPLTFNAISSSLENFRIIIFHLHLFSGILLIVLTALIYGHKYLSNKICMIITMAVVAFMLIYSVLADYKSEDKMSEYFNVKIPTKKTVDNIRTQDTSLYRISNLNYESQDDTEKYDYKLSMVYDGSFAQNIAATNEDDNTALADSILGIKYLLSSDHLSIHPNYSQIDSLTSMIVLENSYAFPIAIGVNEIPSLTMEELEKLNPFQVQENILDTLTGEKVEVFVTPSVLEEVYEENGNSCKKYSISPKQNGELYLNLDNVEGINKELTINVNDEVTSQYKVSSKKKVFNLGYFKIGDTVNVNIVGDSPNLNLGNVVFATEDSRLIEDSYNKLKSMFSNITEASLGHIKITAPNCKGIVLTIPYESGWNITVDGINTKPQIIYDSIMYIPIGSEAQNHYIDMKYTKAGFNLGLVISIISIGVILLLLLRNITVTEEKETL